MQMRKCSGAFPDLPSNRVIGHKLAFDKIFLTHHLKIWYVFVAKSVSIFVGIMKIDTVKISAFMANKTPAEIKSRNSENFVREIKNLENMCNMEGRVLRRIFCVSALQKCGENCKKKLIFRGLKKKIFFGSSMKVICLFQ